MEVTTWRKYQWWPHGGVTTTRKIKTEPSRVPATARISLGPLILLPDVSGIEDEANLRFAALLVSRGFDVILVDLFRGDPWDAARAKCTYEQWRSRHPAQRIDADVASAVSWAAVAHGASVGLMGLCFGGGAGWRAAEAGLPDLGAVVLCYPTRVESSGVIRVPVCDLGAQL